MPLHTRPKPTEHSSDIYSHSQHSIHDLLKIHLMYIPQHPYKHPSLNPLLETPPFPPFPPFSLISLLHAQTDNLNLPPQMINPLLQNSQFRQHSNEIRIRRRNPHLFRDNDLPAIELIGLATDSLGSFEHGFFGHGEEGGVFEEGLFE
jgi:hypothetical protein